MISEIQDDEFKSVSISLSQTASTSWGNRESPAQFENRIKPRVYVRRITRSTMYKKSSILLARTGVREIISVACGFCPIKFSVLIT